MEFIGTNLNTLTDILPFNDGSRPVLRRCTWIAVTFVSYVIGFNLLSKFAKAQLIHEAVPKINQHRLKIALWRIVFALWAIVLYLASVWDSNEGNLLHLILQAAAPKCNTTSLHVSKQNMYSEMALFTAPVSFFLHQIYISISSFTEPAVTTMGGLSLFVFLCNFIDCQKFCLQVLFLLGLNVGTLEVARTIYALRSRCRGFNGPPPSVFLRCMGLPVFIVHLLAWMLINFYLFPKMYFSLPSATEIEPSARIGTVYINLFLIIFAKIQFFDSPAWSLVKLVVRKPSALGRVSGLKSLPMIVLLPYSSSVLPELKAIQLQFLMNALPTSAERRIIRKKIMSGDNQTSAPISEEKANLLSFIKLPEEVSGESQETSTTDLGTSADGDASPTHSETGSSKGTSQAEATPHKQNDEEKQRRLSELDEESQD
ncbi:uncharacterized protein LOC117650037 isoform X2 [Thrips palmi]|uniref:Uncharacterized protein LOC117650037 isoform X2 n=1 Tax=Thrips palmi TaxID=161013 RepID=A0A6P8ZVM1_THRPL|nr:uncharacterized protein LOC117650037 isoform X2 [Thrips palmi]